MDEIHDFSKEPHSGISDIGKELSTIPGEQYRAMYYTEKDPRIYCIRNSQDDVLFFGREDVCIKKIEGSTILVWAYDYNKDLICIYLMDLKKLVRIEDSEAASRNMRMYYPEGNIAVQKYDTVIQFQIPKSYEGSYDLTIPDEMRNFGEVLIIANCFVNETNFSKPYDGNKAIYALDFVNQKVSVYPQDWYNKIYTDFWYPQLRQAKRNRDNSISVNGYFFKPLLLDETYKYNKEPIK